MAIANQNNPIKFLLCLCIAIFLFLNYVESRRCPEPRCRVRKDYSSMTLLERKRFVSAYKKISTTQPYKRSYDKLIKLHSKLFSGSIHKAAQFLPWHRWYLVQLENILRKVDCSVTMPYWDWSLYAHDPWNPNNPIWKGDSSGLGGNGVSPNYCVKTGLFRKGHWKVAREAGEDGEQCLRRDFKGTLPDAIAVTRAMKYTPRQFTAFEKYIRVELHEKVHCLLSSSNGQMCTKYSASAPEFAIHHAFVDKMWKDWQSQSCQHLNSYAGSKRTKLRGFRHRIEHMMNSKTMPGGICVIYEDPTHDGCDKVLKSIRNLDLKRLEAIPRRPTTIFPNSAANLFHISNNGRKAIDDIENELNPKQIPARRQLTSIEKRLGFRVPINAHDEIADDEDWEDAIEDTELEENDLEDLNDVEDDLEDSNEVEDDLEDSNEVEDDLEDLNDVEDNQPEFD